MVVFWVPLGHGYFDAVDDTSDALDYRFFPSRTVERGAMLTLIMLRRIQNVKHGSDVVPLGVLAAFS
jgi:hypothetical protein